MNHLSITAARAIQAQIGLPGTVDALASIIESETVAPLFNTMPVPPDDMDSHVDLAAYAEATLDWRARMGYAAEYDGPIGPQN